MIHDSILSSIGHTPIIKINRLTQGFNVEILAKIEFFNPGGSVKDRIALAMIEDAEQKGLLQPNSLIVEPTSGNTGIGLAMVAASRGYRLLLTMPETMSIERRKILAAYGAQIVLTPGVEGMKGAVNRSREILSENPGAFSPSQFDNPANPSIHEKTTAREIIADLAGKTIDAAVFGVGTGGTITGVARALKKENIAAKIIAIEPTNSPMLSKGTAGPHKIQGIGAGFIPSILDRKLIDEILTVTNEEAMMTARNLARQEGLLVGVSAGAAMAGCLQLAKRCAPNDKKLTLLTLFPDSGERYLSTELYAY